uniref:Uncharacterized protein n=1 Tax=Strigamia maritima TaxID=126957 RepID=T1IV26_STRMM
MNSKKEKPSYKKFSEKFRNVAPLDFQCQVFCRGKKCKYEGSANWRESQMALDGIFSTWITCNILAMARPNTEQIKNINLIDQFHKNGIRTIINLQQAGEHGYCGNGLESGGFSYVSAIFMENGIFFYNFPWRDYGVAPLESITDVMKVIAFSLVEGKVAIHCHAGLGRTGVVIACYLVYSTRIRGNDAIRYVRRRRPNSIQTSIQVATVNSFAEFIFPSFVIINIGDYDEDDEFTVEEHLRRQARILHGFEARNYRYLPKFVHQVCERLLQLAGLQPVVLIKESSSKTLFWKTFLGMSDPTSVSSPKSPTSGETSKADSNKTAEKVSSGKINNSSPSKLKTKGKSVMKSLKRAFKKPLNNLTIEEEDFGVIVESTPSTSGRSSKQSSTGSYESYTVDSSSFEDYEMDKDDKKHYPTPSDNLVDLDDEESFVTWSRWKKKLLEEGEEGEEGEEEDQQPPLDLLENMERIVSQQSSLTLTTDDSNGELDMDAIYTATLPPEMVKPPPVPAKQLLTANQLATALTTNPETLQQTMLAKLEELARALNEDPQNGWKTLTSTSDPVLLVGLLYIWLEQLQQPLISKQDWTQIQSTDYLKDPVQALYRLSKSSRITIEYLLRFVAHIEPISTKQRNLIIKSLVVTMMQRHVGSSVAAADEISNFAHAIIKLIQAKK